MKAAPVLRWFREALTAAGWLWVCLPLPEHAARLSLPPTPGREHLGREGTTAEGRPLLAGPPPGHPERVCANTPLSAVEQHLEGQLGL